MTDQLKTDNLGLMTRKMISMFDDLALKRINDGKFFESKFFDLFINKTDKFIPNHDRKWYQFWKPKIIENPYYDPDYNPNVEIDIVRGNR